MKNSEISNSSYKLTNVIIGWIAFAISAITYMLTVEPTISLWDCGEFITTANGLEIGHPPGAPLFMIMGRFFALFASEPSDVAFMVNTMSVLASAFTILFLFWTITHLAKKIFVKNKTINKNDTIAIMSAGLVGSLAYTFSDTFWFSAVEAEVYALSSLFTAVVFWAILKWENEADKKYANRWLIFIAYLMGLSIGVHLLNLLAIPAIVFVYYFRKYDTSRNGIIYASIISISLIAILMYGIIPGVVKVASWFELFFVNTLGMPFKSGVLVYATLLISLIVFLIKYSIDKKKEILNTVTTCFLVILIGYSSFAMIVIRSIANPPMDENNPDNVFALLSYLNREQYGDKPLFYGQYYNAPIEDIKYTSPIYIQKVKTKINKITNDTTKTDFYKIASRKPQYKYDKKFMTLFPRMHSSDPNHIKQYKYWGDIEKTNPIRLDDGSIRYKPSFVSNIKYMLRYQVGYMYVRYFMWNFVGRQNDLQGTGGILQGNWLSGIEFIDEFRLGNQDKLYPDMKNKKSRNTYFFLPLLLGIIGMIAQYKLGKNSKKDFWVVMLLFVFTGLAIVVYLNQTPYQPRERDYAYAGSFYAFTIWIGFGVLGIYQYGKKLMPAKFAAPLAGLLCLICVPTLLAQQNWDDHDRSGRYATLSYAKNYLNTCDKDAIIFTYGDNDTFPLWYAQEVEGIRRDIRIVNLSLLAGDWYINQMRKKAFDSAPLKMSVGEEKIEPGVRDQIPVFNAIKGHQNLKELVRFVASDNSSTREKTQDGSLVDYMPSTEMFLPVDSLKVLNNGIVKQKDAHLIVDQLKWKLKKNYIFKNELMVYDIIASNKWERPIYFSAGMPTDSFMGLEEYFQLDGAAYKLVPIKTKASRSEIGRINTDVLYEKYMNTFVWGRINQPDVYMDNFHVNQTNIMMYRNNFARLAAALNDENKNEKAIKVLDKSLDVIPLSQISYEASLLAFVQEYFRAGADQKAINLLKGISQNSYEKLDYYMSLEDNYAAALEYEQEREIYIVKSLLELSDLSGNDKLTKEIQNKFEILFKSHM